MKIRLDTLLVEKGIASGREKAKAMIMSGKVFANNLRMDKPGEQVESTLEVEYRGETLVYVSRGGLKLEKAAHVFGIDLSQKVCCDIGASTGGFTDFMLMNGAAKVYAVDVGYGQLAWKLRTDERVINLERTNIRYVDDRTIPEPIDFISIDVSFISLATVLPAAHRLLAPGGRCVCLVKPQFEAGREKVGKKGVVRDIAVHIEVIEKTVAVAAQIGFDVLGISFSPIKGPSGNIEYLLNLQKSDEVPGTVYTQAETPEKVARESHSELSQ